MPPCVEQVLFLALGSIENFCLKRLLYLKWTNSILVNRRLSFLSNCGTTREFSIWISTTFFLVEKVLPDHFQFIFGFNFHAPFFKCHFHLASRCSTSYEKSFRIGTETNLVNFYIHPVSYFSHFNFLLLFVFWAARQNNKYSSTKLARQITRAKLLYNTLMTFECQILSSSLKWKVPFLSQKKECQKRLARRLTRNFFYVFPSRRRFGTWRRQTQYFLHAEQEFSQDQKSKSFHQRKVWFNCPPAE